MTLKQRILAFIMDPNIAFILLAIGALALYAEFNHPGAVVPGTVGVVFILLAVFALNLLPVRFAAVVLILASFALFALEAKFAAHGVLAIGGMVTMILGGLLLVDAPIPEMRVHLLTALAVSIPLGVITVFLMSIALKARANKVVTGAQGLVGEIGVAQTPLSPQRKGLRPWRDLGCDVHESAWPPGRRSWSARSTDCSCGWIRRLRHRLRPSATSGRLNYAVCEATLLPHSGVGIMRGTPMLSGDAVSANGFAIQSASEAFLTIGRGGF